ncbi:MAG: hypothetical protein ACRD4Q_14370, partial [Candidatus Acidiferrales bacterium]
LNLPTGRAAFLDHVWFQENRWLRDRTQPGEYFFGGHCPYFYFPLELEPPSKVLSVTANGFTRPMQVTKLVERLQSDHVQFVMWQTALDRPQYYTPATDYLGPLRAYVRSRYRVVAKFPVMHDQILQRRQRKRERRIQNPQVVATGQPLHDAYSWHGRENPLN